MPKFSNDTAERLTNTAFDIAMTLLTDNRNKPHENQRKALRAILDAMTHMAQGSLRGRWAFGLQTGLGKTTCAMSWVTALARLKLAGEVSAVIAALDVESLCESLDMLEKLKVDKDQVGLLHCKPDARYQPTPNAIHKPILFLCHARVNKDHLDQFKYGGELRDLLIYDESLVTTTSSTCAATTLYDIAGGFANQCRHDEGQQKKYGELSAWLTDCSEAVAAELRRMKDIPVTQSVMRLPARSPETLEQFIELVGGKRGNETVTNLVQLCPAPVKVSNYQNKGVVGFQVSVPQELKNMIILDASHPIRDLVRDDTSVLDAEEHLPSVKSLGFTLASLKLYTGTTVYQMSAGGGKDSMRKSFKQTLAKQRRICQEVIDVLRHIPKDESTLIMAFKPVYEKTGAVNFVKTLTGDITAAGVVTMHEQDSLEIARTTEKPRVSITTWGLHKGTNRHKHCQNLIMVGILHRHPMDLLGVTVGHKNDLNHEPTWQRLKDLQLSEVAHDAFQAIGRIQCRTVVDGVALPVKVWLIHYGNGLRERLAPVMQGAVWTKWKTKYEVIPVDKELGKIQQAATAISAYLDKLASDRTWRVSSQEIRKTIPACGRLHPNTLTLSIEEALTLNKSWLRQGRGLVYGPSSFQN